MSAPGHTPLGYGWIAGTTLRGYPCTMALCTHCGKWLWSRELGSAGHETFQRVVRWYNVRLLRRLWEQR